MLMKCIHNRILTVPNTIRKFVKTFKKVTQKGGQYLQKKRVNALKNVIFLQLNAIYKL